MIEHEGIIEQINGNNIRVRITQQSACSACHAKGACMAADAKEKIVDVNDETGMFNINERVIVEGKESIGYKAIWWAFVLPLMILVAMIIVSIFVLNFSEYQAAIASILILAPYYGLLYLSRKKMANTFKFTIKKTH